MKFGKKKKGKQGNPHPVYRPRWKPGESGNPAGTKKGVVAKKVLREWNQQTVAEAYKKLISMQAPELREVADSLTTPMIEVIIARAMLRDRLEGSTDNLQVILDRAIGKVPIKQELSGAEGVPLVPPQIVFETSGSISKDNMGAT